MDADEASSAPFYKLLIANGFDLSSGVKPRHTCGAPAHRPALISGTPPGIASFTWASNVQWRRPQLVTPLEVLMQLVLVGSLGVLALRTSG